MIKGSIKCSFKDCIQLLKDLPGEFVKKDVTAVQKKVWTKVLEAAKQNCPVDSGNLRDSIVLKSGFRRKDGVVFTTVQLERLSKARWNKRQLSNFARSLGYKSRGSGADASAYYGAFIEFGTIHQSAQPFLRPAFDDNVEAVLNDYHDQLKPALEARFQKLNSAPMKHT